MWSLSVKSLVAVIHVIFTSKKYMFLKRRTNLVACFVTLCFDLFC